MNCREMQDLLTSHLLDELTPEQNAAVREHLQSCPACQTEAQDLRDTLQLLRTGLADTAGLPTRLSDAHAGRIVKALRRRRSWIKRVIFQRHIGTHLMRWAAIFLGIMLLAGLLMPNLARVRGKARRMNDLARLNYNCSTVIGSDRSSALPSAAPASSCVRSAGVAGQVEGFDRGDSAGRAEKAAAGEEKLGGGAADAAAAFAPERRITVSAPACLARMAKEPPATIKTAESKAAIEPHRKIEMARLQRLVNVRDFKKTWGVRAENKDDADAPPPAGLGAIAESSPGNAPGKPAMAAASAPDSDLQEGLPKPRAQDIADTPAVQRGIEADAALPSIPSSRRSAGGINPFVAAAEQPFSTFSIDVDTASYSLARRYLLEGQLPPPESVRTEEFVNYFEYDYAPPKGATFAVHTDCGPSRFGRGLSLLKIGVKGRRLGREEQKKAVLTLLIDTSGSMATPDRMGLLQDALTEMVERLDPADKIAIVQYDSQPRLLLEHTPVSEKRKILDTIQNLRTSGSTALAAGMRLAYATAARGFDSAAANRVLLLSDGMANLGTTSAEEILKSVADYRRQGISLSVFGFGSGSYNDAMLETLADKGDGVYAFIDSPAEGRRVLADELSAAINMIARDVKIQVEFNPQRVKKYRQLGYENRQLKKEQFRDDRVDAGEIGSGQSVTALYELELQGDPRAPLGVVRIRCRNALTGLIEEIEQPIMPPDSAASFAGMDARFRLAAAAAHFAEILRGSPYAAGSQFEDVARVLRPVALELNLDQRIQELLRLAETGLTPKFEEASR